MTGCYAAPNPLAVAPPGSELFYPPETPYLSKWPGDTDDSANAHSLLQGLPKSLTKEWVDLFPLQIQCVKDPVLIEGYTWMVKYLT